jgi:hypothetical protein
MVQLHSSPIYRFLLDQPFAMYSAAAMRLPYNVFLVRPINGIISSIPLPAQKKRSSSIKDTYNIKSSTVQDLNFRVLHHLVRESFNVEHDVASCDCCAGKGVDLEDQSVKTVLAVCGDLRKAQPGGAHLPQLSWAW